VLVLRRFAAGDEAAVRRLHDLALQGAGAHAGPGEWDADLDAIEATYLDGGGEFLVGFVESQLVAMGALRRHGPTLAEITRMRVHPHHQRRGYGRMVLDELESTAAERGYKTLHLQTATVQHAARELYTSAGYAEIGRGHDHGFDVIFFEKKL
jgi:ribosomal protein S18 acetylase RimI-like enzyme